MLQFLWELHFIEALFSATLPGLSSGTLQFLWELHFIEADGSIVLRLFPQEVAVPLGTAVH